MSDKPSRLKFKATGVVVIFGTVDIECDEETLVNPTGVMEVTPMLTLIQQTGQGLATQDVPAMKRLIAHAMLAAAHEHFDPGVSHEPADPKPMSTDELSNLLKGGDVTAIDLVMKRRSIIAQCEEVHDVDMRTCGYSTHWVCGHCLSRLQETL